MKSVYLNVGVSLLLLCGASSAQSVPEQINYQGRLSHQDGSAITNTESQFQFSIYSGLTNIAKLWGPQTFQGTNKVMIIDGFFNVVLGPTDDQTQSLSKAFSSPAAFIEIALVDTKANKTNIFPRQQILSAPYAMRAQQSDRAENGVPAGSILAFGGSVSSVPRGWLLCHGQAVLRDDYPQLYAAIGEAWTIQGETDPRSFVLPDLRGFFLRGAANGTTATDPDRDSRTTRDGKSIIGDRVGSYQPAGTALPRREPFVTSHIGDHTHGYADPRNGQYHGFSYDQNGNTAEYIDGIGTTGGAGAHSHTVDRGGDAETRPVNVSVNYIIKF